MLKHLLLELDLGESESIVLAIELQTPNLLIDEKDGREVALRYHLKPIGLLGVLLEAKKLNLITSVKSCMEDLQTTAGFFISDALYNHVLKLAGEQP